MSGVKAMVQMIRIDNVEAIYLIRGSIWVIFLLILYMQERKVQGLNEDIAIVLFSW